MDILSLIVPIGHTVKTSPCFYLYCNDVFTFKAIFRFSQCPSAQSKKKKKNIPQPSQEHTIKLEYHRHVFLKTLLVLMF